MRSREMSLGEVGLQHGVASGVTGMLGRALLIVPLAQVVAIACYPGASQRFAREIVVSDDGLVVGPS